MQRESQRSEADKNYRKKSTATTIGVCTLMLDKLVSNLGSSPVQMPLEQCDINGAMLYGVAHIRVLRNVRVYYLGEIISYKEAIFDF